jgi:type IV pilus biogenesis protein CpaD/CtpE
MMAGPLRSTARLLCTGIVLAASACAPLPVPTAQQPCPQWVLFPPDYFSNADSPYLGCVVATNLRANAADPADLERGRPLAPANGERETRAVEAYEQGKIKPFQGSGSMSPTINATGTQ